MGHQLEKSVLVIDVGGTAVKILATGQTESRSFRSGPTLTPRQMVSGVKKLAADWTYDVVSIGYPGPVLGGRPIAEPYNLGRGWVGFDFAQAFDRPVKVVNDAAMQALGSYKGGKMLFLGLGTGLGTAMIVEGILAPMELGHLPYKEGTYENYVGRASLERDGEKKWRRHVADVVKRLTAALQPDDTGRQCHQARSTAAAFSPGRECQRLPRRFSVVGRGQYCPAGSAARPRSLRAKDLRDRKCRRWLHDRRPPRHR
jgi:polyphosphate glucokinase